MLKLMQKDALTEFFNIYFRRAVLEMAEVLKRPLELTVVNIELLAFEQIAEREATRKDCLKLVAALDDTAVNFIFELSDAQALAESCLNEKVPQEEIPQDVLMDFSSLCLNALLEALAVLQERWSTATLPRMVKYEPRRKQKPTEYLLALQLSYQKETALAAGVFWLEVGMAADFLQRLDGLLTAEGVGYGKIAD